MVTPIEEYFLTMWIYWAKNSTLIGFKNAEQWRKDAEAYEETKGTTVIN